MDSGESKSVLLDKSFAFAIRVVNLYKFLTEEKREFVLSKQVLRAGTSIGANVNEAKDAESTADFIHKLSIAQKETSETLYWLKLLVATNMIAEEGFESLYNDAIEIYKILTASLKTSKKNRDGN